MKCPKCGGEIPFYNLKPNCRYCGVNIMYFTQEEGLVCDAKRTELEGAAARMIIARVKAEFIGSGLVIARLVLALVAVAALLVPFGSVSYALPFGAGTTLSLGLIGLIQGFTGGFITQIPNFLKSAQFAAPTKLMICPAAVMVLVVLIDAAIIVALILGFLNLTKAAKFMRTAALVGAIVSLVGFAASMIVLRSAGGFASAEVAPGFGALAACVMFLAEFFINRAILKKGIEPVYRENDVKRKELLKKVRKGEVNLDDLPLPVFENEQEHEERMKALEEALRAEEEGKEL